MLIDSHCHIHDTQFYPEDRDEVYAQAHRAEVGMIVVGTSERDSHDAVEFARQRENVWAVVGVHPHDAKDGWGEIAEIIAKKHEHVVGIGEIGLDYFYNNSPREVQIRALEEQLQLAQDYKLPVSFHVRSAFDDFWPIYDNFSAIRGVLHSFTDTAATLEKGLSRGLYIGVNGISTFTRDVAQQEMFASIPLERVLLETDAPFLTPVPHRGKINSPAFVTLVAEHIAHTHNCAYDDVARVTTANARALFAL